MRKQEGRKRKPSEHKSTPGKLIKKSTGINLTVTNPYPTHLQPTPEQCLAIRDDLLAFHGFPQQFAKYRQQRLNLISNNDDKSESFPAPVVSPMESVLDGLVSTILSQNTTDVNSQRAFSSFKSAFPNWEDVSYLKTLTKLGLICFELYFFISPLFPAVIIRN